MVGDDSDGGPPDPIPNSVVKPDHADGTARVTLWESRYRRPSFMKPPRGLPRGGFLWGTSWGIYWFVPGLGGAVFCFCKKHGTITRVGVHQEGLEKVKRMHGMLADWPGVN